MDNVISFFSGSALGFISSTYLFTSKFVFLLNHIAREAVFIFLNFKAISDISDFENESRIMAESRLNTHGEKCPRDYLFNHMYA